MKAWLMLLVVAAIAAVGCREDSELETPSPQISTASASAEGQRWLAVIEVAPRADDLDAATERLREPLGTALVVSPVTCFDGLPDEAGEGYVIGAVASSSDEAERLVADADESVLFTAPVTILCTD